MSWDDVQQYLIGCWELMFGKPEGLRRLDLSIDGFWNSFYAIPLALPALLLIWIGLAGEYPAESGSRAAIAASFGFIDLCGWIIPIVLLAFTARFMDIADRLIAYVVASNWATVIVVWMMVPIAILRMLAPDSGLNTALQLALFIITSVMGWRLTNAVLGKGPAVATAIFLGLMVLSFLIAGVLQGAFGLSLPQAA